MVWGSSCSFLHLWVRNQCFLLLLFFWWHHDLLLITKGWRNLETLFFKLVKEEVDALLSFIRFVVCTIWCVSNDHWECSKTAANMLWKMPSCKRVKRTSILSYRCSMDYGPPWKWTWGMWTSGGPLTGLHRRPGLSWHGKHLRYCLSWAHSDFLGIAVWNSHRLLLTAVCLSEKKSVTERQRSKKPHICGVNPFM